MSLKNFDFEQLKSLYLDQTFDNVAHTKKAAKNTINLYNEIRLYLSLEYKTPNMVYKLSA